MATMPEVDPRRPHGFLKRATVAFALSGVGRWFAINIATRVDPLLLRLSGGRISTFPVVEIVLLTNAELVCSGRQGYRGYGSYAERASHRRIPVMRLSPAGD